MFHEASQTQSVRPARRHVDHRGAWLDQGAGMGQGSRTAGWACRRMRFSFLLYHGENDVEHMRGVRGDAAPGAARRCHRRAHRYLRQGRCAALCAADRGDRRLTDGLHDLRPCALRPDGPRSLACALSRPEPADRSKPQRQRCWLAIARVAALAVSGRATADLRLLHRGEDLARSVAAPPQHEWRAAPADPLGPEEFRLAGSEHADPAPLHAGNRASGLHQGQCRRREDRFLAAAADQTRRPARQRVPAARPQHLQFHHPAECLAARAGPRPDAGRDRPISP